MFRAAVAVTAILCSVLATRPALAEESGEKPNRVERTANRAAKFTEKTATRVGRFVQRTATRAGNFAEKTATKVDKSVRRAVE